jgi:hypothetical protein
MASHNRCVDGKDSRGYVQPCPLKHYVRHLINWQCLPARPSSQRDISEVGTLSGVLGRGPLIRVFSTLGFGVQTHSVTDVKLETYTKQQAGSSGRGQRAESSFINKPYRESLTHGATWTQRLRSRGWKEHHNIT